MNGSEMIGACITLETVEKFRDNFSLENKKEEITRKI